VALIIESSVKYAIGSFNISPSIDFEVEQSVHLPLHDPNRQIKIPTISVNPEYNPFNSPSSKTLQPENRISFTDLLPRKENMLYGSAQKAEQIHIQSEIQHEQESEISTEFIFAANRYIVTAVKSGLMLIDAQAARELILYERTMKALSEAETCASQQLLFPETFELPPAESDILTELIPELDSIGFNISHLGKGSFSCSATPAEWDESFAVLPFIESIIESYQCHLLDAKKEKNTSLALAISKRISSRPPVFQSEQEIHIFIESLFSCPIPDLAPSGGKVIYVLNYNEINKLLQSK
jgi:DNA mismatch repair protein MutL